jgi:NitT/TauT family transport system permease protein
MTESSIPVGTESPDRGRSAARNSFLNWILPIGSFVFLLAVWEAATWSGTVDKLILPPIEDVVRSLWVGLVGGTYWLHIGATLSQALFGYVLAVIFGVGIGALIARFWAVERTVYPYLVALQTLPKVAVAPLIIVWFGYGISSKVVIVTLLSFFPVLVSTIAGIKNCDPGRIDVMRALKANEWDIFWRVRLPSALPFIFAGLNVAAVLAILGSIVGEFVGSKKGLGNLIMEANSQLDIAQVFSLLVILGTIGLAVHWLLERLNRRLLFWSESESLERF